MFKSHLTYYMALNLDVLFIIVVTARTHTHQGAANSDYIV